MTISRPAAKPVDPRFSAGPTRKRPGWTLDALSDAALGRSHRSALGKAKLKEVIDLTREVLGVPDDYRIGIVPASDTGAVEMAMWSMLGERPAIVAAWENFGQAWVVDAEKQLPLKDLTLLTADYGHLPDFSAYDGSQDLVFTANGTTSGVKIADYGFIPNDRGGVTICDATSAVYAQDLPWEKLDVVTYSWQKVMGGEAQHGILILSPRAVERLETYVPAWPLPKIFRLTSGGKLIEGIFRGETINTPSMVCVEDALDGLKWAESIGGAEALTGRSDSNLNAIARWVDDTGWVEFLAATPAIRSNTSVCLSIVDPWFQDLPADVQASVPKKIDAILEKENAAYDINGYRDAPPGLRIWAGATVETQDLQDLFPWLDWAYASVKADLTETK